MTLANPVSPDLKRHLRTLKLGQLLATLPDRLTLARQNKLPHADFLELLLSDEVTRRENGSAARRARTAGLDPDMRLDTWDPTAAVRYDQRLWNELISLRFLDGPHGASDPGRRSLSTGPDAPSSMSLTITVFGFRHRC